VKQDRNIVAVGRVSLLRESDIDDGCPKDDNPRNE